MITISIVQDPNEKTAITLKIMHSLPAWFNPPDDIDKKAIIHRGYPFFVAYDGTEPIGFIALKIHNEYTADVFIIGVIEQYHRQGIGRRLLEAPEEYCAMGLKSELMTAKEASELWGITPRRVQILCEKGNVQGAFRMGRTWTIPKGTPKPIDGRTKAAKEQFGITKQKP